MGNTEYFEGADGPAAEKQILNEEYGPNWEARYPTLDLTGLEPDFLAGYEDRTWQARFDRTHESITLGELLRGLTAWVEANGGLHGPTLEVPRDRTLEGTLRVSAVQAANLVDVLSDYIHGNYLPGDGNGQPRDEAGHPVVEL